MTIDASTLRVLDAALNRAVEGLRVVEDYARFVLDDRHLTEQFKTLRHDLAAVGAALPAAERHAARDTAADVGTAIGTASESRREDPWHVCNANLERTKQSLRSLEEFGKLAGPELGSKFESLRYRFYTLESAIGRTVDAIARLADVRLYVLIDGSKTEAAIAELVAQLIGASVDALQLRDKQLSDAVLVERAKLVCEMARSASATMAPGQTPRRTLCIINDRPDIAVAAGADGVHLGQEDMSIKDARRIVGARRLVGVSTHTLEQARAAVLAGANYVGIGPTFPSPTKQFDTFPGVELVRQVAANIRLPAFAIGGITEGNLSEVLAAGGARIAVSSAITGAPCPATAARRFCSMLRSGS